MQQSQSPGQRLVQRRRARGDAGKRPESATRDDFGFRKLPGETEQMSCGRIVEHVPLAPQGCANRGIVSRGKMFGRQFSDVNGIESIPAEL